jgi:hypothetical protein
MNIIQYIKKQQFNGLTDESKIAEDFNAKYIKVSYECPKDNDLSRRYIFTANKYNSQKVSFLPSDLVLRSEANGLILESTGSDWIALVIPPRTPKSINISAGTLEKFYQEGKYVIYKLEDGTIINLYYYEKRNSEQNNEQTNDQNDEQKSGWIISTARGIEVNTQVFNTLSYQDMFEQSLENIGLDKQEFYSSLDKNTCYTLGFKHPDMHPFQERQAKPVYKVWFVQSTIVSPVQGVQNESESDTSVKINKKTLWKKIPQHIVVKTQFKNVSAIFDARKTSYNDFIYNKKPINFGYILVAKDVSKFNDKYIEYSTVLLESTLMNYIRKLCYDLYRRYEKEYISSSFTKTMIIHAYLSNVNYESFRSIFPQFKYEYDKISKIMQKLVDDILLCAAQDKPLSDDDQYNKIINILTKSVLDKITISTSKNPNQKIQDIIHNIDNFPYFFRLMNDNDKQILLYDDNQSPVKTMEDLSITTKA